MLIWGIWSSRAALAQLKWSRASATILRSDVRFDGEMYHPQIEYEFEYQGIRRIGSQVRSNYVASSFKRSALSVCNRYPVGQRFPVYVDPEDHERSVLEPGGDKRHLLVTFFVAAFFLLLALLSRAK